MKALKYNTEWDIDLKEIERPKIVEPNDVIVKIKYTGICGTDLGIISGAYPMAVNGVTLGHESTGYVDEIGDNVEDFHIGDRVVINPTYYCGKCRMCQTLRINHCLHKFGTESGVSKDGTFAEYYHTTSDYLIKIPDNMSMKAAAMTEPLSCTLMGVSKIHNLTMNVSSIVFGAGPMGILYTWALTLKGIQSIVIENSPLRKSFAESCIPKGIRIFSSLDEADKEYKEGSMVPRDLVIDTTEGVLDKMYPQMSCGGIFVSIGLKNKDVKINTRELADKSLSIIGSIDSSYSSFNEAFYLIRKKVIPTEKFISHTIKIDKYKEAFTLLGYDLEKKKFTGNIGKSGKILLEF